MAQSRIIDTDDAECSTSSDESAQLYSRDFDGSPGLRGIARFVIVAAKQDGEQRTFDWTVALRRITTGNLQILGSALLNDLGLESPDMENLAGVGVNIGVSGTSLTVTVTGIDGVPLEWSVVADYRLVYPSLP